MEVSDCPNCGSDKINMHTSRDWCNPFCWCCDNCEMRGPTWITEEGAACGWNRIAAPAASAKTLRDEFAMKALPALITAQINAAINGVDVPDQTVSEDCYTCADAMMEARKDPESPAACTCHERDSSYTCAACKAEGHYGHMEEDPSEEEE